MAQCEPVVHDHGVTRVAVLQLPALSLHGSPHGCSVADVVARLQHLVDAGRAPHIVILPEEWFGCCHSLDLSCSKPMQLMSDVARRFGVVLVCGTTLESVLAEDRIYCTAVVFGPDGQVLGRYRKRKPTNATLAAGSEALVLDTPFGRLAVLICFDLENADMFAELVAARPNLVLNPIWIPAPRSFSSHSIEQRSSTWSVALETVSRRFEALASEHDLVLVRCDMPVSAVPAALCVPSAPQPLTGALGSSLVITQHGSFYAPTMDECVLLVEVPRHSPRTPSFPGSAIELMRSERADNTGNRFSVRHLHHSQPALVRARAPSSAGTRLDVSRAAAVTALSCNVRDAVALDAPRRPPDRLLWVAYADGLLCGWNIFTRCIAVLPFGGSIASAVTALANDGDNHLVSAHDDRTVRYWDALHATEMHRVQLDHRVVSLCATDLGVAEARYVAGDDAGGVTLLDFGRGAAGAVIVYRRQVLDRAGASVRSLQCASGRVVGVAGAHLFELELESLAQLAGCDEQLPPASSHDTGTCRLRWSWHCESAAELTCCATSVTGTAVAASNGDVYLVRSGDSDGAEPRSVASLASVRTPATEGSGCAGIVWLSRTAFATTDARGCLKMWTVNESMIEEHYAIMLDAPLTSVAYNGNKLYLGRDDGTVSVVAAEKNRAPVTWGHMLLV